eukprot:COSAG06_NODE_12589_length_1360_cov_1.121332_2_plen_29_part_01
MLRTAAARAPPPAVGSESARSAAPDTGKQ